MMHKATPTALSTIVQAVSSHCAADNFQDLCWDLTCDGRACGHGKPTIQVQDIPHDLAPRSGAMKVRAFTTPILVAFAIGVGTSFVEHPASAADDVESKLKVGLTTAATIALMNSDPDGESCRTTLGVRACRLVWTKFFSGRRYEVDFVWDRLVSVRVCRNADTACPSAKTH